GGRAARDAPAEQTAAKEGALERAVAVKAASAETSHLACRVQSWHRLPVVAEHAGVEICLEATQRLAREHIETDRDERSVVWIEDRCRCCNANKALAQDPTCVANDRELGILSRHVSRLCIAVSHLALDDRVLDSIVAGQGVHPRDE